MKKVVIAVTIGILMMAYTNAEAIKENFSNLENSKENMNNEDRTVYYLKEYKPYTVEIASLK